MLLRYESLVPRMSQRGQNSAFAVLRSNVRFRQLRTSRRVGCGQLCANNGLMHCSKTTCVACNDLLDHLVGDLLQMKRHINAEYPGGSHVDDELEPGRQLDRQVADLLALKHAAGIDAGSSIRI